MSKTVYLARVRKSCDGWYAIDFPDLPGTHAQCKNLAELYAEAEESLCSYLIAAEDVGEQTATPSPSLNLEDGEMALIVTADTELYRMRHNMKSVRKTVSIPQWMAEGAEKRRYSLSRILQEALTLKLAEPAAN